MEVISSGIVAVSAGVSSTGLYVIQEGILQVLNKGWAEDIGLANGGNAYVSSGGILYVGTISAGGTATILNEGYVQDITVGSGGLCLVSSVGSASMSLIQSGGTQIVYADAVAPSATVLVGGTLQVSGGYARVPIVSQGGTLYIGDNGMIDRAQIFGTIEVDTGAAANSASVLDGGAASIRSGGYAYDMTIDSGGKLDVCSGGRVLYTSVYGGEVKVSAGGSSLSTRINGGTVILDSDEESGAFASNTIVYLGGVLIISSGATAMKVREYGGYVEVLDGANVTFASNAISGLAVASGNSATAHTGTTVNSAAVDSDGKLEVFSGGKLTGQMTFADGAIVSAYENAVLDFDISELAPGSVARVNDLSLVQGTPLYTLTVSDSPATGIYFLADGAAEFQGSITVVNTTGTDLGMLKVGDTLKIGEKDCTLNLNDSTLTLVVKTQSPLPEELVGTKDRVSWKTPEPERCVVEYSTDSFLHGIQVTTTTNAMDMLALPAGTYQWRVRIEDSDQWIDGNEILSDNIPGTAKVLQSNSDGDGDIFFATADETWEVGYYAQHVGSVNDWTGTNDIVSANGRNRIKTFFFGSDDANILCLTDDANGDAVFVDDEFTELPEEIKTQQSRIAKINEIRCGAGDDIVDMTSQRFEYVGNGLTIRGGAGNDTLWANTGENKLFGDAGDDRIVGASGNDVIAGGIGSDRMHGGGGDDVFTFCENWGTDTVEQLATGSVTLWFASGDESNWNVSTLTYTDGDNSVTVTGVTADRITLKFGENSPGDKEQFDLLSGMGAFLGFSSELVFEESDNGLLASLQV